MSEIKLDMPKTYEPQSVETRLYEKWESEGLFKPAEHKPEGSKPFCIVMPPPNISGTWATPWIIPCPISSCATTA